MWLCQHNYKTYQSNMVPNKVSIVFISACFVRYSHYCCNKYGTYSTFSSVSFCVCVYERASDTTLEGVVTHNTLCQHTSTFNMLIGSCSHEKQAQIPGSGMNERTNKSNPDQNRPNQTEQSPANPNNRNKPASQWEKKRHTGKETNASDYPQNCWVWQTKVPRSRKKCRLGD